MASDGVTARWVYRKARWAAMQTGELGQTRTIINVDEDEALLIARAVARFIEDSGETEDEAAEARREAAIYQPPKRERKAVCIKAAPDDSPFREGRIYTVEADGTIDTVCGKMQTRQQRDARRIAAWKNRFIIIDEDKEEKRESVGSV